jgi:hypothetical protein
LEKRQSIARPALLQLEHAQEMERIEVARALAQRVAIEPLGVVQAALPVILNGLLKCARHAAAP